MSRFVVAALPIVALFAVGHSSPAAADAPTCDPASAAQITAVLTADGHGTFTVGNSLPLCDPVTIGVAVYLKDADGFVVPQTLVDSATGTITSGSKVLSVAMPQTGTKPHCFTQLDAFTGPPLPQITETEQYGSRLLAALHGVVPTCGEVASATTTPTTTTPTTTIPTTTTPTTTRTPITETPAAVEAVEIVNAAPATTTTAAAPAPAEALPSVLARTGPAQPVEPLLAAAGWLLILGGSLLASSNRRGHQLG